MSNANSRVIDAKPIVYQQDSSRLVYICFINAASGNMTFDLRRKYLFFEQIETFYTKLKGNGPRNQQHKHFIHNSPMVAAMFVDKFAEGELRHQSPRCVSISIADTL